MPATASSNAATNQRSQLGRSPPRSKLSGLGGSARSNHSSNSNSINNTPQHQQQQQFPQTIDLSSETIDAEVNLALSELKLSGFGDIHDFDFDRLNSTSSNASQGGGSTSRGSFDSDATSSAGTPISILNNAAAGNNNNAAGWTYR